MNTIRLIASAAIIALTACSQQASAETRLHPVEAVCIDYEQTGMMAGTATECHRNWAHERYTIEDFTMSVMGMTQRHNQHVITVGDQITSWDRDTNVGTVTANPMYDRLVASSSEDIEEFASNMIAAMGFTPTGALQTIAGESCNMYSSPQLGTMCFTSDALVLEQSMDMGMGSFTRRATSIDRGNGGSDGDYQVPDYVTISAGPDLNAILGGFGN